MDRIKPQETEHRRAVPVVGSVPVGTLLHACWREHREHGVDASVGRAVHTDAVLRRAADDSLAGEARSPGQCETSTSTHTADGTGSDLSQTAVVDAGTGTSDLSVPATGAEDRSPRHGVGHRYHVYPSAAGVYLSGGDHGLVQPVCAGLGSFSIDGQRFLRVGIGLGPEACATGDLQLGSGFSVHQRCVYEPTRRRGHPDQHGRPGPVPGQHFRRTSMANGEVRGSVPEGLHERSRGGLEPDCLFQILQSGTRSSGIRLPDTRGDVLSKCEEHGIKGPTIWAECDACYPRDGAM